MQNIEGGRIIKIPKLINDARLQILRFMKDYDKKEYETRTIKNKKTLKFVKKVLSGLKIRDIEVDNVEKFIIYGIDNLYKVWANPPWMFYMKILQQYITNNRQNDMIAIILFQFLLMPTKITSLELFIELIKVFYGNQDKYDVFEWKKAYYEIIDRTMHTITVRKLGRKKIYGRTYVYFRKPSAKKQTIDINKKMGPSAQNFYQHVFSFSPLEIVNIS